MSCVVTYGLALSLVVTSLGLELDSTAGHDGSSQHVTVKPGKVIKDELAQSPSLRRGDSLLVRRKS